MLYKKNVMKEMMDATYWNNRYATDQTGWDLKEVSPPLKAYIDQLTKKNLKILIPGGGYSYRALCLFDSISSYSLIKIILFKNTH